MLCVLKQDLMHAVIVANFVQSGSALKSKIKACLEFRIDDGFSQHLNHFPD